MRGTVVRVGDGSVGGALMSSDYVGLCGWCCQCLTRDCYIVSLIVSFFLFVFCGHTSGARPLFVPAYIFLIFYFILF